MKNLIALLSLLLSLPAFAGIQAKCQKLPGQSNELPKIVNLTEANGQSIQFNFGNASLNRGQVYEATRNFSVAAPKDSHNLYGKVTEFNTSTRASVGILDGEVSIDLSLFYPSAQGNMQINLGKFGSANYACKQF